MALAKQPQSKDATVWGESTAALSHAASHPAPVSWGANTGHLLMATRRIPSQLNSFYKALNRAMQSHPRLLSGVPTSRFWIGSRSPQSRAPACSGTQQLSSWALPVLQADYHANAQEISTRWATASYSKPFSGHPYLTGTIASIFEDDIHHHRC